MGIKSGANGVKRIFVGTTSVKSVYRGTNLVWSYENLDLWRYSNTAISGKTLLYEYLGSWNIGTLNVPKVGGKSVINDWYNSSSKEDIPFRNNLNVISVNLQDVPFRNNSMSHAFLGCRNLVSVSGLSNTTISMVYTFSDCDSFNQNIKIPELVVSLVHTFESCANFNQNMKLPNNVSSLLGTFGYSPRFNQSIRIPHSTKSMSSTFYLCSNLKRNIVIPNSVTELYETIAHCNMKGCWVSIHSANVTNALGFSQWCGHPFNDPLHIVAPVRYINNATTATYNAFNSKDDWHEKAPIDGTGKLTNKNVIVFYGWDFIKGDYNTFSGNGTHWVLSKWNGNLAKARNNGVVVTDVTVPEYFVTYDRFPSALNYPCFRANTVITSVDFGTEIPWVGNKLGLIKNTKNDKTINGAFEGCKALSSIKGVINSSVTSILDAFTDSANISEVDVIIPEGVTNARGAYFNIPNLTHFSPLPSTITGMPSCFDVVGKVEGNLGGSVIIPPSATNLSSLFRNRQENVGNVYILSPSVSSMSNIWANYKNSFKKPFYIYYTYSNGTHTTTYNKFFGKNSWADWYNTTGNNTNADPKYSTASNFYVYNLSNVYNNLWSYELYLAPALKLVKLSKWKGTDPHIAVMANAPDWNVGAITTSCFTGCRTLRTLALYNVSLNNTSNANNITNMFRNCYNLRVVQGLRLDSPYVYNADFSNSYANCYNLRVACPLTNNILKAAYTYDNCRNLNFNCQLGNSVSNLRGTFRNCVNLDRPIEIPESAVDIAYMFQNCSNLKKDFKIPNSVTNMYGTFYGCTRLSNEIEIFSKEIVSAVDCFTLSTGSKTIYIPFYYSNGSHTKTFNSFYSAGYIYENGSSTGRNSTTFYDITY